ncbi:MAG: pyruvate ferredoxin oxidoreductase subunit gamma [Dehalococcoidia bacterium]|nr:MAG: pyruvate ferredoxin oxidoreductase subunit gamma [Dehalococcoidia bacterium]
MKEIRVHARAGQGAITTATILANAAFEDGKYALSFPTFGAARMGAPMNAFVRISDAPIRVRSQIYEPDYVLVQDPSLLRGYDVVAGLKPDGVAVINSAKDPSELGLKTKAKVLTTPASRIAKEIMGRADRVNTALIGAFVAATGELTMEALEKSIYTRFSGKVADSNWKALVEAYNEVKNRGNGL